MRIQTPTTDQILGRLLLAVFPIAAFVLLGLGLQTNDAFGWFVGATVLTITFFARALARGERLSPLTPRETQFAERFSKLREAMAEIPLLQKIDTSVALQLALSMVLGITVATVEQILAASIFNGLATPLDTALSLFVVLGPLYLAEELYRSSHQYSSDLWMQSFRDGLAHVIQRQPRDLGMPAKAAVAALLQSLASVVLRLIAMVIVPLIFSNGYMVAFAAVTAACCVVGFDVFPDLFKGAAAAFKPPAESTIQAGSSSSQKAQESGE